MDKIDRDLARRRRALSATLSANLSAPLSPTVSDSGGQNEKWKKKEKKSIDKESNATTSAEFEIRTVQVGPTLTRPQIKPIQRTNLATKSTVQKMTNISHGITRQMDSNYVLYFISFLFLLK